MKPPILQFEVLIGDQRQPFQLDWDKWGLRVFLKNANHQYLYFNRDCRKAFGLEEASDENSIPTKVYTDRDFFNEDLASRREVEEDKVLQGEPIIDKEEEEVRLSGERTWVRTTKLPLQGFSDEPTGCILGISVDISEYKRLQIRQGLIIDLVPDLVFTKVFDHNTGEFRFEFVNRTAAEALGRELKYIVGQTDQDFGFSDEQLRGYRRDDRHVFDSGSPIEQIEQINWARRGQRYLRTIKVPLTCDSKRIGVIGVSADITDQIAERKLLNTMLETVPAAICLKDSNGKFLRVNRAFAELVKSTPEEINGKCDDDFFAKSA